MQELKWFKINNGFGTGIDVFTTEEYFNAYVNKSIDVEMINDIKKEFTGSFNIFDVGMFIGLSSMIFSKICGNDGVVVGFEPNPYNCERIQLNLEKNTDLSPKIKLKKYALSNTNEIVEMNLSSVIEGPSSTSRIEGTHPSISDNKLPNCFKKELVQTHKLDDVIKTIDVVPNAIKIDIEGAEHLMLMGAIETIKKYHPILYIEMHSQYCTMKCIEILTTINYSCYILNEEEDNRIMVKAKYHEEKNKIEKFIDISSLEINQLNLEKNIKNTLSLIDKKYDYLANLINNIEKNNNKFEEQLEAKHDNLVCFIDNKIGQMESRLLKEIKLIKTLNSKIREQNDLKFKELNNRLKDMENSYNNVLNSKSWKFTKPLRIVSEKIHKRDGEKNEK